MFLGETILIDFSLGFSFEHKEAPHVALTNKPKSVIRPFNVISTRGMTSQCDRSSPIFFQFQTVIMPSVITDQPHPTQKI